MRWSCVAIVAAVSGCVMFQPDPDEPTLVTATVSPKLGVTTIREPATDGADEPGFAIGAVASVLYRFRQDLAAGISLDFAISGHDTKVSEQIAGHTNAFLPVPAVRYELGRFGVMAWTGYYVGRRTITEPGGIFGRNQVSALKQHGVGAMVAGFVRVKPNRAPCFEIGPFLQLTELWSKEDESATTFDEAGMRTQSMTLGMLFQVAFGSGPTSR
jgi:hypothetical protein